MDLNRVLPKGKYLVRVGGSSTSLSEPLTLSTIPTAKNIAGVSQTITAAKPITPPCNHVPSRL